MSNVFFHGVFFQQNRIWLRLSGWMRFCETGQASDRLLADIPNVKYVASESFYPAANVQLTAENSWLVFSRIKPKCQETLVRQQFCSLFRRLFTAAFCSPWFFPLDCPPDPFFATPAEPPQHAFPPLPRHPGQQLRSAGPRGSPSFAATIWSIIINSIIAPTASWCFISPSFGLPCSPGGCRPGQPPPGGPRTSRGRLPLRIVIWMSSTAMGLEAWVVLGWVFCPRVFRVFSWIVDVIVDFREIFVLGQNRNVSVDNLCFIIFFQRASRCSNLFLG